VLDIKIKFKIPFLDKGKRGKGKSIKTNEVRSFLEKQRNKGQISEYYEKLESSYNNFMKKLQEVKQEIKKLENEGERTFTRAVKKKIDKIKSLDDFSVSSYQRFYTDTFEIIDKMIRISPRTQRRVLKFKKGKETIDAINSFLARLKDVKKVLSKRYSEYSVVNHFEKGLKKEREVKEIKEDLKAIKNKVTLIEKKLNKKKELLKNKESSLQNLKSEVDSDKIKKIKDKVRNLDKKIEKSESKLRVNLTLARRPISKILHSSGNKKIFDFFREDFVELPSGNINEKFWKMVDIVKNSDNGLSETEKDNVKKFLRFVENHLGKNISKSQDWEKEKKKLKGKLDKIISENKKVLREKEREIRKIKRDVNRAKRRLENLEKERSEKEKKLRKETKVLKIILSKVSGHKISIIPP